MIKFEAGKTYSTRSIGDSNCIIRFKVTNRTAKTVQGELEGEGFRTFRVKANWDNSAEMFKPWGAGSLCPVMNATDTAELLPDWAKSQNPVAIARHQGEEARILTAAENRRIDRHIAALDTMTLDQLNALVVPPPARTVCP